MSPALLSKRLKELEEWGVVERVPVPREPDVMEYRLTASGQELAPIIEAVGVWGHRWTETKPQLEKLDAGLLMWDMRRNLNVDRLPSRRAVIQFIYPERRHGERHWWIVVDPKDGADLCAKDPGFDVDLYIKTDLLTMTSIYMGTDKFSKAIDEERLILIGDTVLQKSLQDWLGLGLFSSVKKRVP